MRHADDGTLNAWLDGALPRDDAAALAFHLEHCDACRTRLAEATHWRHGAQSILASAAPADVTTPPFDRVLERAAARPPAGPQPIVHHRPGQPLQALPAWATLTWAATIALALLVGWYAREMVIQQPTPTRSESGRLAGSAAVPPAGSAPAPAAGSEAPAAPSAPPPGSSAAAKGHPFEALTAIPPDIPPPAAAGRADAPGRVARTREADYAGAGVSGGAPSAPRNLAAARDTTARAEPLAAPAAAVPPGAGVVTAASQEAVRAALGARATQVRGMPEKTIVASSIPNMERQKSFAERDAAAQLPAKMLNVTAQNVEAAPTFTPYTVAPELRNREEVKRALVALYPIAEKNAGFGGTTMVWLFIDERGTVLRTLVKESSRYPALDSAALQVGRLMRFSPGLNRDLPVKVWVAVPVIFKSEP